MGPTLMAPPQTMLESMSLTWVWNRDVGSVTRQNLGCSAWAAEQVASVQETRKYPCPVEPAVPSGWVLGGRSVGLGDAIVLSFVQVVFRRPPPEFSICSFA